MGEELTKLEIGDISKLIAAIYITDTDFRKILLKSVMGAFKTSHQNTNIQYGFGGTKPDQHAIDYLQERVFILSDKTTSKLEGDLRFELISGLKNNESIREITKRLDNIFSDMMPYQLERIARTEIIDAQNGGRISAYKASDVVEYKMWIAAKGGKGKRVCALCARLNGQIQPLGKPFIDPETGGSWQHPVAHPNGRCTTVPLTRLPNDVIVAGGLMYKKTDGMGKIEIPIDLLKSRQKRKAWVVRYANGYAVQCFEDEADADHFIETSKKKDAGWFDFINKVYREVKPGWVINKKGTKITFKIMSESERKAFDEKLLNEDKRVKKIEIQISQLEKFSETGLVRKKVPVTRKGKKTMEYRWVRTEERVKVSEMGMSKENIVTSVSGNEIGLKGSLHSIDIDIIEFKDGSKAIHKANLEPYQIIGEKEYYRINKILGWDICPETIEIDIGRGGGSCQKWISGAREPYDEYNEETGIKIEEKYFDDLAKIFVQDIIVGNRDRHHLNIAIKGDKCYAIDNENWGSVIPREDYMEALDFRAGLGIDKLRSPMTDWLDKSLNTEDYSKFRQHVIKYIMDALKHKDEINKVYTEYYKSSDRVISLSSDSIKENIEYLERYLKGD